jgi:hypothetical protein
MTDTPPATPAAPPADQTAAAAVEQSAAAGETPAQAQAAASTAVAQAAPQLTDAEVDRIAARLTAQFEAKGAFETAPPPPAAGTASPSGDGTNADGDATPGDPPAEEKPKKRTLAEKFAGVNK